MGVVIIFVLTYVVGLAAALGVLTGFLILG